jgi:hypothetical protein
MKLFILKLKRKDNDVRHTMTRVESHVVAAAREAC